jgi:hypothetical protein
MRALTRGASLIVCVTMAAACTSPGPGVADSFHRTALPGEADVFVRGCTGIVSGTLGAGWKKRAVVIGPIAFVGLNGVASEPDRFFRSKRGRYPSLKALAVVKGGAKVTVTVAARDVVRVRLLYDPASWTDRNLYPLEAGDTRTVFGPCLPGRWAQFNGGFLVTGRTCATLIVTGDGTQPARRLVSFGATSCPA